MNKFKAGDYVVPVRVMRTDDAVVQELGNQVGKVLQVLIAFHGIGLSVFAGNSKGEAWDWHPAELRMATAEEIEAATKPKPLKPLKRGDLVMLNGQIGVVHEIDPDGECWVAPLTGDGGCVCRRPDKLIYMGTIRKKIKRLMSQLPEFENE